MKFISWNVNGIRAVIKKGFYDFMNEYKPDIIIVAGWSNIIEEKILEIPSSKKEITY